MTPIADLLFLDTSALAKRYISTEANAERVEALCAEDGTTLVLSRFAQTELASTVYRRERAGEFPPGDAEMMWTAFRTHAITSYRIINVTESLLRDAERLLERHSLRAADSLHIATAQSAGRDARRIRFITGDRRQANAATAEGMDVVFVGD